MGKHTRAGGERVLDFGLWIGRLRRLRLGCRCRRPLGLRPVVIPTYKEIDADIILTRPDYERAAAAEELYAEAKNKFRFIIRDDVRFAAAYVLGKARPQDAILVTGSFYLISDFLKAINFKYF